MRLVAGVELGGLAAPGSIGLDVQRDGLRLQFPLEVPRANVALTNRSLVSVASDGGGTVTINARNLNILGNSVIRGGIETGATATRPAGDIVINATQEVRLDGSNTEINNNIRGSSVGAAGAIAINTGALSLINGAYIRSDTFGLGNAGKIVINTDTLSLTNQAVLRSAIFGQGNSGNILINARDSALLDASNIQTGAFAGGNGNGSIVQITTGSLALLNGARLDTGSGGQGNGGTIIIQATGAVNLSGSSKSNRSAFTTGISQNGVGTGGDIIIIAESLGLKNGQLSAGVAGINENGANSGRGNAGNITLHIRDVVSIEGSTSGIISQLGIGATGKAGQITLNAGSLSILKGGVIESSAFGQGDAGNILIQVANGITLANSSAISSGVLTAPGQPTAVGDGGEIRIRAQSLELTDRSFISAQTNGPGDAGNLFITVDALQLNNATIGASPSNGDKRGNIQIDVHDAVILQNKANIQSVLFSGTGRSGDVTINTGNLYLINALGVTTATDGTGDAGNINLNIRDFMLVDNSLIISAVYTNAQGNGGNININTGSFALVNAGLLNAATYGQGDAGNIIINARSELSH
jgi:large exoprotein involved in heme utilization and adhesion